MALASQEDPEISPSLERFSRHRSLQPGHRELRGGAATPLQPASELSSWRPSLPAEAKGVVVGEHHCLLRPRLFPFCHHRCHRHRRGRLTSTSLKTPQGLVLPVSVWIPAACLPPTRGFAADGPGVSCIIATSHKGCGVLNRLEVFCVDLCPRSCQDCWGKRTHMTQEADVRHTQKGTHY